MAAIARWKRPSREGSLGARQVHRHRAPPCHRRLLDPSPRDLHFRPLRDAATTLLEQTLADRIAVLGEQHPDTLRSSVAIPRSSELTTRSPENDKPTTRNPENDTGSGLLHPQRPTLVAIGIPLTCREDRRTFAGCLTGLSPPLSHQLVVILRLDGLGANVRPCSRAGVPRPPTRHRGRRPPGSVRSDGAIGRAPRRR
jgi:hypothetical protein